MDNINERSDHNTNTNDDDGGNAIINGEKLNDDDEDDFSKESARFRQRAAAGSPPFFHFPVPTSDEPRHFKDRALNLAMEFNGDRIRGRGIHPRPLSPMLGPPKAEEPGQRRTPSPANNESEANEGGPASMAASVQAALAALQAGQISLNQVRLPCLCPKTIKTFHCDFILIEVVFNVGLKNV